MFSKIDPNLVQYFFLIKRSGIACLALTVTVMVAAAAFGSGVFAQGNTSGGFKGVVRDKGTGNPVAGATVVLRNQDTGTKATLITDDQGAYSKGSLPPGAYDIEVSAANYAPKTQVQTLYAMASYPVEPDPFYLEPIAVAVVPTPVVPSNPTVPVPAATPAVPVTRQNTSVAGVENIDLNPRRGGIFGRSSVTGLPLGGNTLTRTFDELAFLIPGVNPPPQAIGNSVGPGVGGGVGTSGQFSINGLRSRANNFTVDGSDNNDEDIGVRRQGFFTLVSQPIESIQEFQIITLLAPAEFGRNLGAQVNALSRSGGNRFSGSVYGLGNADFLNARNFFDTAGGDTTINLTALRFGSPIPVLVDGVQRRVTNNAGEKDEFSLLHGGLAVGGRIVRDKAFFFVSAEGQRLKGTQERHFAVPTVEQRSLFGAVGGLQTCFGTIVGANCTDGNGVLKNRNPAFPTSIDGDAVFSLFPFANNPNGVYGANTYSQALSTDASGRIFSGRFDWNLFRINNNQQAFVARYNHTGDERDLTDVGGALFSAIRPVVRTNNFSSFLNGSLTDNTSNELRFSWGRTRLRFDELPDTTGFLRPISNSLITDARERRFLINAPLLFNVTLPNQCSPVACVAAQQSRYATTNFTTQDSNLGPVGQLSIAGFSPVGIDVFNFPQERTNDTYQVADTFRWQFGRHSVSMGTDIRRVFLDSDLPRNSRPLVTFNGGVAFRTVGGVQQAVISSPLDLAASGAATGFFQSLVLPGQDSSIRLSYTQFDFFAQDEWRAARNLLINFGLRYEYNTVPKEKDRKIENTFATPSSQFPSIASINTFQGFQAFLAGRTQIYEADGDNFAPRIGFAWSPTTTTVIRGGYGLYYDQILGAVVSQSRNVFPTFTTLNTGGGDLFCNDGDFALLNPIGGLYSTTSCSMGLLPIVRNGTLNELNPQFNRLALLNSLLLFFPFENGTFFGATIPSIKLPTPMAHQFSIGVEQKLFRDTFLSLAYVGTTGRHLLRFTTPNLGSNYIARIDGFSLPPGCETNVSACSPVANGTTFDPFSNSADRTRPNRNVGPISQFETTGRSMYNSFQMGLRGSLARDLRYQLNYVFGDVKDDVSDVFDLAGSSALPQNSINFAGEYASANFDVRHRFTYNFIYGFPKLERRGDAIRYIFGGWELAGTGKFNTGQPFTVNTVFDINFDGNLTDRLNTTQGIGITGDRRQPLSLTATNTNSLLAQFGQDGQVGRNSFRAGSILDLDMSLSRRFRFTENHNLQFRVDFFNFINRANFGVPVRVLESPGFGRANDTITPGRRVQFGLKYTF